MKINGKNYRTIWFNEKEKIVEIIDQTQLPHNFTTSKLTNLEETINMIF